MGPACEDRWRRLHLRRTWIAAIALLAISIPAQAQMHQESHPPARHGGGSTLRDVGTGLAIGVIVGGAIRELSKSSSAPSPNAKRASKPKKAGKSTSSTRKKQAAPATKPPAPPAGSPKEEGRPQAPAEASPASSPPSVPVSAAPATASAPETEPCDECLDLWNRIRRYQELIAQEQRELENLEQTKTARENEGKEARAIRASGQIEENYNRQLADIAEQFVKERSELIDSWKARIAKEQAFLDDLLVQFRKCVERYCAKLAVEPGPVPEPAPVSAPTQEPPDAPVPTSQAPASFCPANANATPVKEKLVHDYRPNGPRPPVPADRIFHLGQMPEEVGWFALFSFYNGSQGRMPAGSDYVFKDPLKPQPPGWTPSGFPTDAVIIEGDVLDVVQQQDEVIELNNMAKQSLSANADDMFSRLRCGQSGLFTNRGGKVVVANLAATRVHLAFGSFSVYWDAVCQIGPKRCCIPDSECASGWRNETLYNCTVKWTMYDTYNFSHTSGTGGTGWLKRLNPLGWAGTPFRSFGYWDDVAGGVKRQCVGQ